MAKCIMCPADLPASPMSTRGAKSPCCSAQCKLERERQLARARRRADPDRHNNYQRNWCRANPDRVKKYAESKKEQSKVWSRKSYEKHREQYLAKSKELWATNEEFRARNYKRVAANIEKERARGRAKSLTRRAIKKGLFSEKVDPLVVIARDSWVCQICMLAIAPGDKWHVDHKVPLSKGGVHSYDNVQAAHAKCNMAKGASLPPSWTLFQRAG